ncbi:hypothetical protein B0H63DRAFT_478316 [Podospora didyma]|uniref:RRM domain-containing protein n=1 Tax=Podospora didyma TaxID=330526 RepID=A0AAE0KL37_9PEZI|nr:hypothetical protein B0H63DRAFT_478316 [Podospora didyma]
MAAKDSESGSESGSPQSPQQRKSASSPSKKRKTDIDEIAVDLTLPEPPSKKAKRALKKGKTLPTKVNSDDEDDDGEAKTAEEKKVKKERSPYGVWIGNLRFSVTKGDLRKWLVENSGGTIKDEDITRVHLPTVKKVDGGPKKPDAPPAENRGFAYVDFATLSANTTAIALSEIEWHRRKLLIKDSKSFDGRPKKPELVEGEGEAAVDNTLPKKNPSTKVFVGNLAFTVTEDDLHAHFEKCGKIRWIKVATFEDTGKCKGYGWVNFEEPESAEWAVKGFVKIQEKIETLEDFMDEDEPAAAEKDDDDTDASDVEQEAKPAPKKAAAKGKPAEPARIKTRKWWVNQLLGRNLKIELAEDDQSRYTKRFKKGGPKNDGEPKERRGPPGGPDRPPAPRKEYTKKKEGINTYSNDIMVARLTGAPVKSEGKKTTFD